MLKALVLALTLALTLGDAKGMDLPLLMEVIQPLFPGKLMQD